jgi:Flp pilus assembly protein protease CpaA
MDMATVMMTVQMVAVATFVTAALVTDVRTLKIPNWLTVSAFVAGLVFHAATQQGWNRLTFALGGFAVGFGIMLLLWLIGGSGAGDVKLMGALGAWIGAKPTLIVFLFTGVLALTMVGFWFLYDLSRGHKPFQQERLRGKGRFGDIRTRTPYGVLTVVATYGWMILEILKWVVHRAMVSG